MQKEQDVSVWLVPQTNQLLGLQQTVDDLAARFNSYSFIPHITLYHPQTLIPVQEVTQTIEQIVAGSGPIDLEFEAILWGDVFTQTFYLRYKSNQYLQSLLSKLKTKFADRIDYNLAPHLSLVYSHQMTEIDKQKQKASLNPPQTLTLDKVQIIVKDGSIIASEADVKDWKLYKEFPL